MKRYKIPAASWCSNSGPAPRTCGARTLFLMERRSSVLLLRSHLTVLMFRARTYGAQAPALWAVAPFGPSLLENPEGFLELLPSRQSFTSPPPSRSPPAPAVRNTPRRSSPAPLASDRLPSPSRIRRTGRARPSPGQMSWGQAPPTAAGHRLQQLHPCCKGVRKQERKHSWRGESSIHCNFYDSPLNQHVRSFHLQQI